jgi:helix-turn-helix protein
MEHRQAEGRQAMPYRASGDDSARFLQELRQLRDGAGLGPAELAARAHYPYDRIRAAEVGPSLPDLPVLSAYVRGCGGTTEEWEERWRSLTSSPTLPLHAARPAGSSTAASAGARIGSISPAADTPDPSIILAALDRVAEEMAVAPPAPPAPPAPLPSGSGMSTMEQRPGVAPAAPKSAGGKAGTGTAAAWETTAMRTAWSSAPAPAAWEGGQPAAIAESAAKADEPAAAVAEPVAGNAELAGSPTAARAMTESGGAGTSGRSAASRPVAAATTSATVRAPSGPAAPGRRSAAGQRSRSVSHSRTTTAALIVIAVCLLAAVLAIFV